MATIKVTNYKRKYKMRNQIIEALQAHAKGHIEKHIANINIMLEKQVGVAEHPDTLETIEKELLIIAEYDDQLEILNKYFITKDPFKS